MRAPVEAVTPSAPSRGSGKRAALVLALVLSIPSVLPPVPGDDAPAPATAAASPSAGGWSLAGGGLTAASVADLSSLRAALALLGARESGEGALQALLHAAGAPAAPQDDSAAMGERLSDVLRALAALSPDPEIASSGVTAADALPASLQGCLLPLARAQLRAAKVVVAGGGSDAIAIAAQVVDAAAMEATPCLKEWSLLLSFRSPGEGFVLDPASLPKAAEDLGALPAGALDLAARLYGGEYRATGTPDAWRTLPLGVAMLKLYDAINQVSDLPLPLTGEDFLGLILLNAAPEELQAAVAPQVLALAQAILGRGQLLQDGGLGLTGLQGMAACWRDLETRLSAAPTRDALAAAEACLSRLEKVPRQGFLDLASGILSASDPAPLPDGVGAGSTGPALLPGQRHLPGQENVPGSLPAGGLSSMVWPASFTISACDPVGGSLDKSAQIPGVMTVETRCDNGTVRANIVVLPLGEQVCCDRLFPSPMEKVRFDNSTLTLTIFDDRNRNGNPDAGEIDLATPPLRDPARDVVLRDPFDLVLVLGEGSTTVDDSFGGQQRTLGPDRTPGRVHETYNGEPLTCRQSVFERGVCLSGVRSLVDDFVNPILEESGLAPLSGGIYPPLYDALGTRVNVTVNPSHDILLTVDFGGDDVYENNAGGVNVTKALRKAETFLDPSVDRDANSIPAQLSCYLGTTDVTSPGTCEDFGWGDYPDLNVTLEIQGVAVAIDYGGNDSYTNMSDFSQGAAFLGIGILQDFAGHDVYAARNLSQGAGIAGVGILLDADGDDRYAAVNASQAYAATMGLGLLLDLAGNDAYSAKSHSAGVANFTSLSFEPFTGFFDGVDTTQFAALPGPRIQGGSVKLPGAGGAAILLDGQGNDAYDHPREGANQGRATPLAAGLLLDLAGQDAGLRTHLYANNTALGSVGVATGDSTNSTLDPGELADLAAHPNDVVQSAAFQLPNSVLDLANGGAPQAEPYHSLFNLTALGFVLDLEATPDPSPLQGSGYVLRLPGTTLEGQGPTPFRTRIPGLFALGSTEPTTWTEPYILGVDLGGDDAYTTAGTARFAPTALLDDGDAQPVREGNPPTITPQVPVNRLRDRLNDTGLLAPVALHLDLAGNDAYNSTVNSSETFGYGYGAVGALYDLAGNDRYEAVSRALGAGVLFGAGILADLDGADTYRLTGWQGASRGLGYAESGGIGILFDQRGGDAYLAADHALGATHTWILPTGANPNTKNASANLRERGLFLDAGGQDRYEALNLSLGTACGLNTTKKLNCGRSVDVETNPHYADALFIDDGLDADAYNATLVANGAGNNRHWCRGGTNDTLCGQLASAQLIAELSQGRVPEQLAVAEGRGIDNLDYYANFLVAKNAPEAVLGLRAILLSPAVEMCELDDTTPEDCQAPDSVCPEDCVSPTPNSTFPDRPLVQGNVSVRLHVSKGVASAILNTNDLARRLLLQSGIAADPLAKEVNDKLRLLNESLKALRDTLNQTIRNLPGTIRDKYNMTENLTHWGLDYLWLSYNSTMFYLGCRSPSGETVPGLPPGSTDGCDLDRAQFRATDQGVDRFGGQLAPGQTFPDTEEQYGTLNDAADDVPLNELNAFVVSLRPAYAFTDVNNSTSNGVTLLAGGLTSSRSRTGAVWDGAKFHVYGGTDGSRHFAQDLEVVPAKDLAGQPPTTVRRFPVLPSVIGRSSEAVVQIGNAAYLIGGYNATHGPLRTITRCTIDGSVNSINSANPNEPAACANMTPVLPTGRTDASAISNGVDVFVFGGHNSTSGAYLAEIVKFTPATGAVAAIAGATLSPARSETSAVWNGTHALIFGGRSAAGILDEIVAFDPLTKERKIIGTLPSPRAGTSAIWDGTNAFVFGGYGPSGYLDEILRFNVSAPPVFVARLPTPRANASAAWDGSAAYVFGGFDGVKHLGEIVKYSVTTNNPPQVYVGSGNVPQAVPVAGGWPLPESGHTLFGTTGTLNGTFGASHWAARTILILGRLALDEALKPVEPIVGGDIVDLMGPIDTALGLVGIAYDSLPDVCPNNNFSRGGSCAARHAIQAMSEQSRAVVRALRDGKLIQDNEGAGQISRVELLAVKDGSALLVGCADHSGVQGCGPAALPDGNYTFDWNTSLRDADGKTVFRDAYYGLVARAYFCHGNPPPACGSAPAATWDRYGLYPGESVQDVLLDNPPSVERVRVGNLTTLSPLDPLDVSRPFAFQANVSEPVYFVVSVANASGLVARIPALGNRSSVVEAGSDVAVLGGADWDGHGNVPPFVGVALDGGTYDLTIAVEDRDARPDAVADAADATLIVDNVRPVSRVRVVGAQSANGGNVTNITASNGGNLNLAIDLVNSQDLLAGVEHYQIWVQVRDPAGNVVPGGDWFPNASLLPANNLTPTVHYRFWSCSSPEAEAPRCVQDVNQYRFASVAKSTTGLTELQPGMVGGTLPTDDPGETVTRLDLTRPETELEPLPEKTNARQLSLAWRVLSNDIVGVRALYSINDATAGFREFYSTVTPFLAGHNRVTWDADALGVSLSHGDVVYLKVVSTDAAGNAELDVVDAVVEYDLEGPLLVSNGGVPDVLAITPVSFVASWTTDEPMANGSVAVSGPAGTLSSPIVVTSGDRRQAQVSVSGLKPATPYSYAITLEDVLGNVRTSAGFSLTTHDALKLRIDRPNGTLATGPVRVDFATHDVKLDFRLRFNITLILGNTTTHGLADYDFTVQADDTPQQFVFDSGKFPDSRHAVVRIKANNSLNPDAPITAFSPPFPIDNSAPRSAASTQGSGNNGWFNSSVVLTLQGQDEVSGVREIRFSRDNRTFTPYTGPFEIAQEGRNRVHHVAIDNAGHSGAVLEERIPIDRAPPTAAISVDAGAVTPKTEVLLRLEAVDALSGVRSVRVGDLGRALQPVISFNPGVGKALLPWTLPPGDGRKTIVLVAEDVAGNTAETRATVRLDRTPPQIARHAVEEITFTTATVVWQTDEPASGAVEAWSLASPAFVSRFEEDGVARAHAVTLTRLAPGTQHGFRILASDAVANTATLEGIFRTPDDLEPPSAPLNLRARDLRTGEVLLEWQAAEDNAGIRGYEVFRGLHVEILEPLSDTRDTGYVDDSAVPGINHAYAVRAVDVAGNRGPPTPVLVAMGTTPPVLEDGSVSPEVGREGELFTYRIVYRDPDNSPPVYVRVLINGKAFPMTRGEGASFRQGIVYTYTTRLTAATLADGIPTYRFDASDGQDAVHFPRTPASGPAVVRADAGEDAGLFGWTKSVPGIETGAIALAAIAAAVFAARRKLPPRREMP